jgi:hypothetical protein
MNAAQKPSGGPGISHGKFHHTQQAAPSFRWAVIFPVAQPVPESALAFLDAHRIPPHHGRKHHIDFKAIR